MLKYVVYMWEQIAKSDWFYCNTKKIIVIKPIGEGGLHYPPPPLGIGGKMVVQLLQLWQFHHRNKVLCTNGN